MPTQPKRICTYPGCNTLVLKARCSKHPYPKGKRRAPRNKQYDTKTWRVARARTLRANPFCQYQTKCNGAPATQVDHADNNQNNNAPENLVSCCRACHSHKTATVDMDRQQGRWHRRRTNDL